MEVRLLTIRQKNELQGQEIQDSWYYNPIQDADKNWIITNEEVLGTTNPDFLWVYELPEIPWNPPSLDPNNF